MKRYTWILLIITSSVIAYGQSTRFSTAWFGPNALPVPEFGDGRIPKFTTLELNSDYYFGFGDRTVNGYFRAEIPLLPERVSVKIWSSFAEHYWVSNQISNDRNMNGITSGKANGDIYLQSRILLLTEKKFRPSAIFNSTMKTASGTNVKQSRYFDTPGYYFDIESGKSFDLNMSIVDDVRLVLNTGFLSWQTNSNTQNDAFIYALKLISKKDNLMMENTISGYSGWKSKHQMYGSDYGDRPLIYSSRINYILNNNIIFIQYQYGLRDFPYNQVRLGWRTTLPFLTPNYKN